MLPIPRFFTNDSYWRSDHYFGTRYAQARQMSLDVRVPTAFTILEDF